ncbi:hypothetical protein LBMAG42_17350 [Deltaproteobacteria bacterium]|nr:hypothetical protein LBMAG42_17350 [Deltaproteobacteria bacterium]
MRWRVATLIVVVVVGVIVTTSVGAGMWRGEPAAVPARCTDFWRREHAVDCRIRLAVEAFARNPVAGKAAIAALPEPFERDYAWYRVVETVASCREYCKHIGEPTFVESCLSVVARPWKHASGTKCPETAKILADPVKPAVEEDRAEVPRVGHIDVKAGDAGAIQATIRASKGRIETCVQVALMIDPSTAGRVGVGFDLSQGLAQNVVVTKNTTANDELARCIAKQVGKMRFDPELVAHVDEYAWVVSGR